MEFPSIVEEQEGEEVTIQIEDPHPFRTDRMPTCQLGEGGENGLPLAASTSGLCILLESLTTAHGGARTETERRPQKRTRIPCCWTNGK